MGSLLAETIEAEKIRKAGKTSKRSVCCHIFCLCRYDDTTGLINRIPYPNLYLNHIGNRRTSLFRKPWHPFVRTIFEDSPAIRILPDSSR